MKKAILIFFTVLTVFLLVGCNNEDIEDTDYLVSFESNQGEELSDIKVMKGNTVTLPTPIREGYTFIGWTTLDNPNSEIIVDSFTPEDDVTLYAQLLKKFLLIWIYQIHMRSSQ